MRWSWRSAAEKRARARHGICSTGPRGLWDVKQMRTESKLRFLGMLMLAGALLPAQAARACDCSVLPTLGRAFDYSAMGFGENDITMSGSAFADNGNIGLATGGKKVTLSGGATIDGYIHHHSGTSVDLWSPAAAGSGTAVNDMSGPKADALAFAAAMAAFPPTQTYSKIDTPTTITGNGCVNIIRVNDDVSLGGADQITFDGGPDDYFIINVYGGVSFSGDGAINLVGGVESQHVLFNVLVSGKDVTISGDSSANATFITPDGKVTASGGGSSLGAFYGSGRDLSGRASVEGRPFQCDCTTIDPVLLGTNVQRPAAPARRGAGNSHFFLASFDFEAEEGKLEALRIDQPGDIYDKSGQPAVDGATNLFEAGRTPYWEAGAQLASNSSRKIYTTKGGVRTDFTAANITTADLGLIAADLLLFPNYPGSGVDTLPEGTTAVIDYVHGKDAFDEDVNGDFGEMRSWVLGPILHSNVLLIDGPRTALAAEDGYVSYLTAYEKRDRVVYAGGGSDTLLHAFDAGSWFDPADPLAFDPGSGSELFAYLPGVLLDRARKSVYDDDTVQFFVDGNLGAADAWLGDGTGTDVTKTVEEWATVMIAAMRNGGRGYLALDVTDPSAVGVPHGPYPKLLWEFTDAKLGYSWSVPIITRVKLKGTAAMLDHCGDDDGEDPCREQWVAIFAGGYEQDGNPNHGSYISNPLSAAWSDRSKAIFMVALDTGQLLASIEFDNAGVSGPSEMKYSISSTPAVLDLDGDGFADVVYVGDLGGQVWKWDVSAVGEDTADADTLIDNWPYGLFFKVDPEDLGGGVFRYRSMFVEPSAALIDGELNLAFGTGEREDLLYEGDPAEDENNRFYVVTDPDPTGPFAFPGTLAEGDLTDITGLGSDPDPADRGFYFVADDGEKFVGGTVIFGGFAITVSFVPEEASACGPGTAFLYLFDLETGTGFFAGGDAGVSNSGRTLSIGSGMPSSPRMSLGGAGGADDSLYVQTSTGELIKLDAPERSAQVGLVYWKQDF
jgi:hypothetical protein